MYAPLDLEVVNPLLIDQVVRAFKEGDAGGFVFACGCRGSELALVADNLLPLRQRGIYDECLLFAFTDARHNFHKWPTCILELLFNRVNKAKMRAAGDPIPDQPTFQIYRGIAGHRDRRPRGFSWTLSQDVACWFATRYSLANPCVVFAEVDNEEVLAYVNDRDEQEIVCRPKKCRKMKLTEAEIKEGAQRHHQAMQGRSEKTKAKLLSKVQEVRSGAEDA